ncbi:MAG: amidohydrolase family protein [Desulfurivibrio sp.]|nr:amidohydrolase family protein [Desulfurivibrio sp.]
MSPTHIIVAGNLLDGCTTQARRQVLLTVEEGIITAIEAAPQLTDQARAALTDFSHCTLVPPLVDCSLSLASSAAVGWPPAAPADATGQLSAMERRRRHALYCHLHGVLGIADNDQPEPPTNGAAGTTPTGLVEWRAAGPDFLRLVYTANIEDGFPDRELGEAALNRALEGRHGRPAVVVANGRQPVAAALKAGCEAIEQGYGMGEDNLRTMARRGVLWIPSLLRARNALDGASGGGSVCCRFSQRYVAPGKPDPGARAFWQKTLAAQLAQLRRARELGVTTALGTGAGSHGIIHGESMVEEMKLFIKAGYSLAESIRCASANGAAFFGLQKLGTLSTGSPATFLVSRGTLAQLPRKLSYLEAIYIDGAPSALYHKDPR